MTLWRRAPREVYRVYGEKEYLAEGDSLIEGHEQSGDESRMDEATRVQDAQIPSFDSGTRSSRSVRLVGLGLLMGVTAGVLALVVSNASHRSGTGAPHSAKSTKLPATHHPSAGALAKANRTGRAPALPIPGQHTPRLPRVSVSARKHVHPVSHGGSTSDRASAGVTRPSRYWISSSEPSSTATESTPVIEEFDFER
jgi:hypothetical protein